MPAGLSPTGLVIKRLADLRSDLRAAIAADPYFGKKAQTGAAYALGVIVDLVAVPLASLWSLAQSIYDQFRPGAAEGAQLDNVCSLVGMTGRLPATHSIGVVTLTGVIATVIPSGSRCRVTGGPIFETTENGTVGGGGTVDVDCQSIDTGPIEAIMGAIDSIVTPVVGWTGVSNALAVVPGRDVETDAELRIRREQSVVAPGSCTDQAIRADLEALADVEAAVVISNRTLVVDGYGTPGKSFLTVIWPNTADQDAIADVLWDNLSAGMYSHGVDVTKTITDSRGYAQVVRWSWATDLELHVEAVLTYSAPYAPATSDDLVAAAILAEAEYFEVGGDVEVDDFVAAISRRTDAGIKAIPGIVTLSVRVKFGAAPGPGDTVNLAVAITAIATLDPGDIVVTSTPA
jgi:hypothetical protein